MTDEPDRGWYPYDYAQDETLPVARESPEAWLRRYPEGWSIDHQHFDDKEAAEYEWAPTILADGAKVVFVYAQWLGSVSLTVHPDGTFTAAEPIDPKANNFYDSETEAWGDSIKEFAENVAKPPFGDPISADFSVDVSCSHWSDTLTYALVITSDTATLVPAGTA